MLKNVALKGIELAVNRYLELDPDCIQDIAQLSGKVVQIQITDWNLQWFIQLTKSGLDFSAEAPATPDTIVSGKLFDLFNLGVNKGSNEALFSTSVDISGDSALGEKIRDIFSRLDIDWEEHLSRFTGDIIAYKLGSTARSIFKSGKNAADALSLNVKEFLQSESKQLASRPEVEQFVEAVSTLRDDVDRAEARINRYLNKKRAS
jgi:ubiquinone biosynthesis protein UbiJ